ncbi:hypothetical protein KC349_g2489 [Hortaea werneckii]|nr:hypothetical protein KC349_g2489 [Hortaea werneckii]
MIEYIYTANYGLPTAPTIRVPSYVPGGNGATTNDLAIIGANAKDLAFRRFKQDIQTHNPEGFIYVIREINELVSMDETRLRGIIHDLCFRNIDKFVSDSFFMTALAGLPGLQDFTVGLLGEVARAKEGQKRGLERELERKDAEIRRVKENQDAKAAHTQNVLQTLIGVVGKLRSGCPQGCGNNFAFCRVRRKPHPTYGKAEGACNEEMEIGSEDHVTMASSHSSRQKRMLQGYRRCDAVLCTSSSLDKFFFLIVARLSDTGMILASIYRR